MHIVTQYVVYRVYHLKGYCRVAFKIAYIKIVMVLFFEIMQLLFSELTYPSRCEASCIIPNSRDILSVYCLPKRVRES